jgi:phosphoribosylamine--glycine ligase
MKSDILVIGSGGREHALCWKLKQSPLAGRLYCAPGNGGIADVAECVSLVSQEAVVAFCRERSIALVVIGPEQPLVEGLADTLRSAGIAAFGPGRKAAQLEGSKAFTKRLCEKYGIPTAAYGEFTDAAAAKDYARAQALPLVIKADGLAAGKGVVIAQSLDEALAAVDEMFSGAFGTAGERVVIEAFLEGEEVSFFALSDGETAIEFGHAQDHKRVGEGDTGPNTGGMGTYAPAPVATAALRERAMREIIHPTVAAMKAEGMPFQGVLFAGLMVTKDGPQLLEYNARFGDPETQVLMRRLEGDLLPLLMWSAGVEGTPTPALPLAGGGSNAAMCVVMAAKGYPGAYAKGSAIGGLARAAAMAEVVVFHAGTARQGEKIVANGGRVLGVTATGATIAQAQAQAYRAVDAIDWPEGFCRRDIGWRAINKE